VSSLSSQDQLKAMVAQKAVELIKPQTWVGVGTGSTVNFFIDALARSGLAIKGTVSSSEASTQRLKSLGVQVLSSEEVPVLDVYVDGADEIDPKGFMIKGGGAALTREKIVAAQSKSFICIVDQSKWVPILGHFPLPVEIIPMAAPKLIERFKAIGGQARIRSKDGRVVVTDNHQHILDVHGLSIQDPLAFESMVNQWPGVITVGVFAHQKASVCLLGSTEGVKTIEF
jgi:ribose 5-phosphate isomerase A